jgi:hypothetical protein
VAGAAGITDAFAARLAAALITLLGLLLLTAGRAEATPGIDATWGNVEINASGIGGFFSRQPRGVAVNGTSGDIYVTDAQNNRIQRFGAGSPFNAGTFLSAWGKNVDAVAPGSGYEVCAVAADCLAAESGGLGGEFSAPAGIAIDQASGDLYVVDTNNHRVQELSAAGNFVRTFGWDVVSAGPEDSAADEQDVLTVRATAGTFTLTFAGQTTAAIPFNASAAAAQSALNALSSIGGAGGSVAVSGGPGDATGATPYTVTFGGALGGDDVGAITSSAANLSGGSPTTAANVVTSVPGGAFEVCETPASCKEGMVGSEAGAFGAFGSITQPNSQYTAGSGLAVAPAGAPNVGHVLVADAGNSRIQEFTATGQFVRAFGWDVVASGPDDDTTAPANEFEVCQAGFDVCKAGSAGAGKGQFGASGPTRAAEDKFGRIYTIEPTGNFRAQRFTLPGNVPTPQGEFAAAVLHGSQSAFNQPRDHTTEVAVDDGGAVYVVKAFPLGTGVPPVVTEGAGEVKWQQRVLKLDPVSEEVLAVMAANPGTVNFGGAQNFTFENATGLAVASAGAPIYATTATFLLSERPRVWRLQEIAGPAASGVQADEVGASTATLKATIEPAAIPLGSAYRFEYSADEITWTKAPATDARIGNGSAGGTSNSCPLPEAATCEVAREISGLVPGSTYHLRLVVYSLFDKGQARTVPGPDFTTAPNPPVTTTGAAQWSSPAATAPSLLLHGKVNPGNGRTTYYFQYVDDTSFQAEKVSGGSGFEHATQVPAEAAEAGRGLEDVAVGEVVTGLDPTQSYHYRLVASNPVGTQAGAGREVTPPSDSDRFYELVSVGDSGGAGTAVELGLVADSGERTIFGAQTFDEPRSAGGFLNGYLSLRGEHGWTVTHTELDAERAQTTSGSALAPPLGTSLSLAASRGEQAQGEAQWVLSRMDGSLQTLGYVAPLQRIGSGHFNMVGAAANLSRAFIRFGGLGAATLMPGEDIVGAGHSNLYEVRGLDEGGAAATIVNRADGKEGAVIGGACGAEITNGPHATSIDGTAVYFYAFPETASGAVSCKGTRRLFERIDGKTTAEISKSQCARVSPPCSAADADDEYKGASADGQVVFFTTTRQLTDSDIDATRDLYVYDADPPAGQPHLSQASAGGAKVLGFFDNSENGSRAYFVAEGTLTGPNGEGKTPSANKPNLYVYERDAAHPSGRIAFVGTLKAGEGPSGDTRNWGGGEVGGKQATALPQDGTGGGAGGTLIFISAANLLAVDTDSSKDLYRYDDSTETITCLSCQGAAGVPAGTGNGNFEVRVLGRDTQNQTTYAQQARMASDDLSTVVFATQEQLSPEDENASWDAYAWHQGQVELISQTGPFGMPENSFKQVTISRDGRNIFFTTRATLVGTDTNNSVDVYDARVGGGFPEAAPTAPCSDALGCQGAVAPPLGGSAAGSESAQPSGIAPAPLPPPCPKGKVRKNGRCVKKPTRHGHTKKHRRQAGKRRGTGR